MSRTLAQLQRDLTRAQAAATVASEARRALPPGSSRARVTTANARWSTKCEAVDRLTAAIADARAAEVSHA